MKLNKLKHIICIGIIILPLKPINCNAQNHSIGVNMALLAVGSINIELSKAFSKKVTAHVPISWNPITFSNNKKIKHIMLQPGIRWWQWHSYSGYFGGINITIAQFNTGIKALRYYGKGAGVTISAGYAKMLSKRWNLEAEAGFYSGWIKYNKYQRKHCGDYEGNWSGIKLFPAKISLSLIYVM